jgi:ATP-dependent Clp protease protease subunit
MPDDVKKTLEQVEGLETLNIYINSPGGSVFAGLAIYNMLSRNTAKKIVHIDGVAASMASVIALVGDEIYMPSNAFMMIHKPWTFAVGNADDLRKTADDLDSIEQGLMKVYEENLREGVDIEEVKEMVSNETWLTADEASKYFNVEVISAKQVAASAKHLLSKYKNVPKELLKEDESDVERIVANAKKEAYERRWENKTDKELEKIKLQNELDLLSL